MRESLKECQHLDCRRGCGIVLHGLLRHIDSAAGFPASSLLGAEKLMAQKYYSRRLGL